LSPDGRAADQPLGLGLGLVVLMGLGLLLAFGLAFEARRLRPEEPNLRRMATACV
jgi:hypothetical protein